MVREWCQGDLLKEADLQEHSLFLRRCAGDATALAGGTAFGSIRLFHAGALLSNYSPSASTRKLVETRYEFDARHDRQIGV